ncbi:MAG: hypothetical protein V4717_05365 [Bacteroidota bacterium]
MYHQHFRDCENTCARADDKTFTAFTSRQKKYSNKKMNQGIRKTSFYRYFICL